MKAEDLSDYFSRKLAKPISFDIEMLDFESDHSVRRVYTIERTGLRYGAARARLVRTPPDAGGGATVA